MDSKSQGQREVTGLSEEHAQLETSLIDTQQLLEDLKMLPERYRLPLQLRFQEKWSSYEIAQYLNKPLGTIESLLWRGKRRLEKLGKLKLCRHSHTSKKTVDTEMAEHIEKLPRPYRGTLQSHYLSKQTYIQMAQASGIPIGTLKSRVYRGRKLLFDFFSVKTDRETV